MGEFKQINNIQELLVDDLHNHLTQYRNENSKVRLSIAAASFSIYAFEALKEELEHIDELRFIFTSPTFIADSTAKKEKREFFIPKLNRERSLYGSDFEIRLRNKLSQKAIAKECADWIRRKVRFKSIATENHMDDFLHIDGQDKYVYFPFKDFTTPTLGIDKDNNCFTLINRLPLPMADEYLKRFNEQWDNKRNFEDVTERILERIETVYRENSPDFIYFITLYNIFNEFLEDISEDVLPNEATGFKDSQIWNKLYNFQKDACLAIINKLEKYNGCILADSVGLGKTFTALSVIKYYEAKNRNVLVLCPKKLSDNWMAFRNNYKNNPVAADRLRFDVLFHTDLSRETGESNGIKLNSINWANYDLIVIDESHNFRNGGKISTDEGDENPRENRYLHLLNKVIRPGIKTKVLMLSATPVNNGFKDLKNQLALAYEGNPNLIDNVLDTQSSINDIFRLAQFAYNKWSKLPVEERTVANLMNRLSFDFFEVLDSVTIARSRKHIQRYYNTADIGSFPERCKPISHRPPLTDLYETANYSDIYAVLHNLNLAVYTPSAFIHTSQMHKYNPQKVGVGLSIVGRENGLRKLMAINLLKRLESSVNSFRLSLERIQEYIENMVSRVDNYKKGNDLATVDNYDEEDFDEDNERLLTGRKTKIHLADMDYTSWKHYMEEDLEKFRALLLMLQDITPAHDAKLQKLKADITDKIANPINSGNHKIIIFTAFSDTAVYLYNHLSNWVLDEFGLHCALITGSLDCRSTVNNIKSDFNTLLTLFSPVSKDRDILYPKLKDVNIDILIATDCISEGQNLQDCDCLINYDIHWNPVRIIQRFGRIDRIGSKNERIQLVNYWPDVELDDYIQLKGRVEARMKVTVMTATGDDNLLSDEEKGDLEYRREQLRKLQQEVVDLEDMDSGVNIMDLGLNEFRLDLLSYMKDNPDIEHTPFGLHAVVPADDENPAGVVYVLKNRNNGINIDYKNRLHPFYMVYISEDKEVVINHLSSKDLLDRLRFLCKGKDSPDIHICREFNRMTRDGKNMRYYSDLLGDAIASIINVKEECDIDSFLSGVQGSLFTDKIKGLDDFELICFFVVK